MIQQGQVFKLTARSAGREPLWRIAIASLVAAGEAAGGRVQQQGRGAAGSSTQTGAAGDGRPLGDNHARGVGRGVSRGALG